MMRCALLVAAALLAPLPVFAQSAQATLQASPTTAFVGSNVTFTLAVPAYVARANKLRAGSAVMIQFGDNQTGSILLSPYGDSLTGQTTHSYGSPNTYTVTVSGSGTFAVAATALASTTVKVLAPPKAVPTPTSSSKPTGVPSAPPAAGVKLLEATLTWPSGAYSLHLSSGETVPQPIARVRVSSSAEIVAQWSVDGAPVQTVRANAAGTMPVTFRYLGTLPRGGSHSVAFDVISPAQGGLVRATPPPPIGYEYGGIGIVVQPSAAPYTSLHFQGFIVSPVHFTSAGPQYSGTGAAHIANLSFTVSFSNLTVVPDHCPLSCPGQGAVTSGMAVSAIATPPPQGFQGNRKGGAANNGGIHRAPSNGNPLEFIGCPLPYLTGFGQFGAGITFEGAVGTFTRYGYTFGLMGALLEPVGTPSQATLCWAPVGVDVASSTDASNGFNNAPGIGFHEFQNQLVLTLSQIQIDEDGEFDDDIPGNTVGPYRLGYTPFDVMPTQAQTLKLRFSNSDSPPHAAFDGTPATGPILQQIYPSTVNMTVSTCNWDPGGIDANVSVDPGQSIYVSEPTNFKLTIGQNILAIQNSFFLGGNMSGAFAANQRAPALPTPAGGFHYYGKIQSSASRAYENAAQSASSYNASQQSSSGFHFTGVSHSVPPTSVFGSATTNPSGGFSGPFTAAGDLVASATPGTYSTAGYQITASHASLFVPGGQSTYQPDGGFDLLMQVIAAVSPLWSQIPQLNYNPQTGYTWSGFHGIGNIVGQLQAGGQGQGGVAFRAGNGTLGNLGNIQQIIGSAASPVTATPAMPFPGLYIDQGSIQTPSQSGSSAFNASVQGQGFGFGFTDGGGNSGLFSLAAGINSHYGSFPINLQILNVELLDSQVAKAGAWGVLQIPAPVSATLPIKIEQINPDGSFGTPVVPQNAQIALTAWKASLSPNQDVAVGTSSITVPNATLSIQGLSEQPAVQGTLLASGTIQNDQLLPIGQLSSTRVAGLDFQPLSFSFPSNGGAPGIYGSGSIAGWVANQMMTLTLQGNNFAPPSGFHFGASQSFGPVSMSANISYANGAWDGSGQLQTSDFINASFGLHVDDQNETGEVGVNVPGGSGSSSSGPVTMAGIAGGARFNRDNGALEALAFAATLNLSAFSGKAVVLYDTNLNDQLVQAAVQRAGINGTNGLNSRGWNCSQAWCLTGSITVAIDSNDKLYGELDALFNNGFDMYADGKLQTVLATVEAKAQLGYFDDGEWDMGFYYSPIPILGINFNGEACFWNHHGGAHVANCLDSNFSERGLGGYVGVGANINLGDIANASADADVWAGDAIGVGAHLDASGSIGVAGIGATADASLDLSTDPVGFAGHAHLYFCACIGSLDIKVGAHWYEGQSFGVDDAGLGLGGPCGFCDPSNWF
jgi:hypothetical protein